MIELSLNNVTKYYGATLALRGVTFQVKRGEKAGIVGRNGSGKTTILKIIANVEKIDEGNISIRRGTTIGYLKQIPDYPMECSAYDVLNSAFDSLSGIEETMRDLENRMKTLSGEDLEKTLKRYSNVQETYEALGGYEKEEKFSKICEGLKFSEDFLKRPFHILSGGEKTTLILGKILLENPDILLLDEPTNHLDMDSLEWLEGYLLESKSTVIIVSHDRYFLDKVITKTIEVENLCCETYKGNYSKYIKDKEEKMLLQFKFYKEQQKDIQSMEESIRRLRDWSNNGENVKFIRRAMSMEKKLDKMEKIDRPSFEKENMKIKFISSDRSGEEVIKVEDLRKSFEEKVLIDNGSLLVRYGERTALIGQNGSGKTTFLKMLLKEEKIDKGLVTLGSNVRWAYLPQNIFFNDEEATVLQCFRDDIEILEGKAREYLSKFMFFGEDVFKKVENLSGGEKTRLKLSKLLYEDINLLILDEPTNHLDIDSIETLEEALEDFKGTIFFISHDRYFINKISNRVIAIEDKKFNNYLGNYDYYRNHIKEKTQLIKEEIKVKKQKVQKVKTIDESKKKEREISRLERNMEDLEEEIKVIDNKMKEKDLNYEDLNKLFNEKEELQGKIDKVLEEWIIYN
ncbi:ribosomal protection-like ABC-F family protein [Clostridium sp.]|uniref:ribosomal protection-like ABC-F family protein n=1 Tax=Clostridium sp. TaxID=1506 RepID=UPI0034643089